jgi:FkbM family methyltransferase
MIFIHGFKNNIKQIIGKFPRLMKIYWHIRYGRQILDEPIVTPLGFKIIGNTAMEQGTFEPEETEIVIQILQKVDVFVNIGANIGYYCCMALNCGKKTIAFEPMQFNLQYLYKNIKANHWEDKIEVFPVALSNNYGIIDIYGFGTGASLIKGWSQTPEKCLTQVPVTTLDKVLGSRLGDNRVFILADIEGAEKYMLEGAACFLNQEPKPIWMIEICIEEHQPQGTMINPNLLSTFNIFWEAGYEAWTADKQFRIVTCDEISNIVCTGIDTINEHNFLFIEDGKKSQILNTKI